jgi:hypothetical protein
MANALLTSQVITRMPLAVLKNNTVAIPQMTRDYDKEFGKKGDKIGDTVYVRKPARAIGRDGSGYAPEPMIDTEVPISITQQSGVDFQFSTAEKKLSLDEMSKRYLIPYGIAIANKLDLRALQMAQQNTFNFVGTPGVTPGLSGSNAFLTWMQAGAFLDIMGFPLKGGSRCAFMNPDGRVGWVSYNSALFNNQTELGEQWKTGQVMGNPLGYKWWIDQNMPTQTIGTLGGTPTANGANQTGTSILTTGWTASITNVLNVGDKISFAGVYSVNPQSRLSTGKLANFTIQAAASSDGSGNATLTIYPAIVPSGQFQNVTNSPSVNALINVFGAAAAGQGALSALPTVQNMLWDKTAFAFVSFPGDVPDGVDMGDEERDEDTGVSMRFVRQFIGGTDQWINRFDVYYGYGPLYAEGSVVICG